MDYLLAKHQNLQMAIYKPFFSVQRVLLISRGFLRDENADKDQPTRKFLHCILTTKTSTDGIPRETISSPTTLTIQ